MTGDGVGGYGSLQAASSPRSRQKPQQPSQDYRILAWCLTILVVLFVAGGAVFSWLEREAELQKYERNRRFYEEMQGLYQWSKCSDERFQGMALCRNQEAFAPMLARFFERTGNEMQDMERWTLFGSAFFVGTLVTTLGYGSHHPLTPAGQLFTVGFGIIGIPLMAFVLSHFGRWVIDAWLRLCPSMRTRPQEVAVLGMLTAAFILLGGVVFMHLEGWDFVASTYFASVTLTTVGFGDIAPTHTGSRVAALLFTLTGVGVMASFLAVLQMELEETAVIAKRVRRSLAGASAQPATPTESPRFRLPGGVRL